MMAAERREVIEEVVSQHKQSLGEWESTEQVWDMQAETSVGGCPIQQLGT